MKGFNWLADADQQHNLSMVHRQYS